MSTNSLRKLAIPALLLAIIFLGAQLHFCADLASGPFGSHICPLCTSAASVDVIESPSIAMVALVDRLEFFPVVETASAEAVRATSPRAPPAV